MGGAGGGRAERGEADLSVPDPGDPDVQVGIQPFLAHLSALLKVLTRQGPGQRTPRHMSQADGLVVKTGPDYSTSGPPRKTLSMEGGTRAFMRGHVSKLSKWKNM